MSSKNQLQEINGATFVADYIDAKAAGSIDPDVITAAKAGAVLSFINYRTDDALVVYTSVVDDVVIPAALMVNAGTASEVDAAGLPDVLRNFMPSDFVSFDLTPGITAADINGLVVSMPNTFTAGYLAGADIPS